MESPRSMPPASLPILWVVDDDANIRATVSMVLRFDGYPVETFENGLQALDALATRDPAELPRLVLLDHQMPGLEGGQVLERIRREPSLKSIKVVMLTGCALEPYFPGADELLRKPVDIDQLLAAISRQLGQASLPPAAAGVPLSGLRPS